MKHLAVIPDGNRRWSKQHGKRLLDGYAEGVNALKCLIKQCVAYRLTHLSVYALSSENLQQRRSNDLSALFVNFFMRARRAQFLEFLLTHNIACRLEGDVSFLSPKRQAVLNSFCAKTQENSYKLQLIVYFNYSGQTEIIDGVKTYLNEGSIESLTVERFDQYLNPHRYPKPDVLLRTGGRGRLSNFLLWHLGYAEIYFEECFWPDYNTSSFIKMYDWFMKQERNFGK